MTAPAGLAVGKKMLPEKEFVAGFHAIGEERYHHQHPFHLLMHEGKLTRGQLQAWALNRYYYQSHIPMKDAVILAHSEDPAFRLAWRKRIDRSRWRGKQAGRDRKMAAAGGSHRIGAQAGRCRATGYCRPRALRSMRTLILCTHPHD